MDKKYITLFKELAQAIATSAEQVMDYDKQKEDNEGFKTATILRDDFQTLADKINDEYVVNRTDAIKFLVGAMIMVNQLTDRIANLRQAVAGYQTDLIPKLQNIIDNTTDDIATSEIANTLFITDNNK